MKAFTTQPKSKDRYSKWKRTPLLQKQNNCSYIVILWTLSCELWKQSLTSHSPKHSCKHVSVHLRAFIHLFRWVDDLLYVHSHTNPGSLKTKWAMKYAILVWPITGAPLPPHQEDGSSTQGPQTPSIGAPGSTPGKCFFDVTMKSGSMVIYRLWFSENWGCSCNQTVCISLQETACSRDYNTSTEDTPELGMELTAC